MNIKQKELSRYNIAIQENFFWNRNSSFTVADLFCGVGGLSLGFVQAGFRICLACDNDKLACDTLRFNHPEVPRSKILNGTVKQYLPHLKEVAEEATDVLLGGPPCQGFSYANHRSPANDPRNKLYRDFIDAAKVLTPKIIVMENVRGMLRIADLVCKDFEKISLKINGSKESYKISYRMLNAYDFGVAQKRERIIFICVRTDILRKNEIDPELLFDDINSVCKTKDRFTLGAALDKIRQLEPPNQMHVGEVDKKEWGCKVEVNPYRGNETKYLRQINLNRSIRYIYNHKARYCSKLNHEIYSLMKQGDDGTCKSISHIFPYHNRNNIFKDKYFRLYEDRPCRTITAHMRSDCHSHIHPRQHRALSPREAARVQSFPDDYLFLGPYLMPYKHIGNSVPPLMSRIIAKSIKKFLKNT